MGSASGTTVLGTDPRLLGRVVEREARIYRRLWRSSLFSSFLGPVLFLVAMGFGLGSLVDESTGTVDGLSYLDFVAPGLLAATAMLNAGADSLWPVLGGMKWLRFYHGMVATPVGPAEVYGGYVSWISLRIGITAVAFVIVAGILGALTSPWAVLAVPAAMLTGLAFAAPMVAWSAGQENDAAFSVVFRVVLQPLFLFSGTFFPVSQLPDALQWLAVLSPLWHGVELCRAATTGTFDPAAVVGHTAALLAVVAVGWRFGVRRFAARLQP